jgi:hypothetical protein
MAINIGVTGSAGRFIGGGAGVYRNTQLKMYLDPFKYAAWTAETASTFLDISGWGNNMTMVNGARSRTDGWWSFDGTDDFGYRTDDSDFDYGTTIDFSIQMWYYNLGGNGSDFYLISKGKKSSAKGNPATGFSLFWNTGTSELRLRMNESTGINSPGNTHNWAQAQWINLAVVVDRSSDVKFYKNGVLATTETGSTTAQNISNDRYIVIGGSQNTNSTTGVLDDFNGYMGHILIYSTLLDEDEIRQNFNAHRGIYGV